MPTNFDTLANFAASTVAAPGRASGAGTLPLAPGTGARFGAPTPANPIRVVATPAANIDGSGRLVDPSLAVILRATGRTADTLTGCTPIEGTTDRALASGDPVALIVTAGHLQELAAAIRAAEQAIDDIELTPGPTGPQGDPGADGVQGDDGATGSPGVIAATAPLSYDAPTQTVSFAAVAANRVLAGPTSGGAGAVTARTLAAADLPGGVALLAAVNVWTAGPQAFTASGLSIVLDPAGKQITMPAEFGLGAGSHGNLGTNAIAIGLDAVASEIGSLAIGNGSTSSGPQSIVIGSSSSTSVGYSFVLGSYCAVTGSSATVIGYNCSSTVGAGAVVIGSSCVSTHRNTCVLGYNGVTTDTGQIVFSSDFQAPSFWLQQSTSTNVIRCIVGITGVYADNTNASYKSRLGLHACDFAGNREGLRIEADGTQAMIGFFGGAASARGAAVADADGTLAGATAQLNALLARLRAYNLFAP